MSSLAFKDAAEIVYGYKEHSCIDCGRLHLVPPWFKPFKEYCDECRRERIEEYAGLDREPCEPEEQETDDE